jgi:hypothetical protein
MPRLLDWEQRLYAYLAEVRATPYDVVQHNCAHYILGVVAAVTGDDAVARLGIALPETEMGVGRLLAEYGGMRGIAEAYFGTPAAAPLLGRRGDVGIADGVDGEVLGVFDSDGLLCLTHEGLWRFSLAECKGSWALG